MYKVTNAKEDFIELSKNENWNNPDNVELKIDKVVINFYETMGDVYNDLKIGNIDMICT